MEQISNEKRDADIKDYYIKTFSYYNIIFGGEDSTGIASYPQETTETDVATGEVYKRGDGVSSVRG